MINFIVGINSMIQKYTKKKLIVITMINLKEKKSIKNLIDITMIHYFHVIFLSLQQRQN
jgi:hypothetical protein